MPPAPSGTRSRSSIDESLQKPDSDVVGASLTSRDRANLGQAYGDTPSNTNGSVNLPVNKSPYAPPSPSGYHNSPSLTRNRPALENEDHTDIPNVIEVIESLIMEAEPDATTKVESWRYNVSPVLKDGEMAAPSLIGDKDRIDIPNGFKAIKSLGNEAEPDVTTKVESWRYNVSPVLKDGEMAAPRLIRNHAAPKNKDHTDIFEGIKSLENEAEPDVTIKVESWRYNASLVFKHGEPFDMALLDRERKLVHSGKLLRRPDSVLGWNGWSEVFVLLFDDCLVMTIPEETDGVVKYIVEKRPLLLDLLTLVNFHDPPTQRRAGLLRGLCGLNGTQYADTYLEPAVHSGFVYPMILHHNGRSRGPCILYAESSQSRTEWQAKLMNAMAMHNAVQESNKTFKIETLSADTLLVPPGATTASARNQDNAFAGRVTCSVPFNAPDGGRLVAVGCAEGVWVGSSHNPRSLRRVLHLKQVTQCAILVDFGIFLVLADKSLFAYNIEALMPLSPHLAHQDAPHMFNKNKDVHFFSVGTVRGKTLVVYMRKKNMDSIFRVLEPIGVKIDKEAKAPAGFGFRSTKLDQFRICRDFFLPFQTHDLIFLGGRIAILCNKSFHIMDIDAFEIVAIPGCKDRRLSHIAKRCKSSRPVGIFRSSNGEFLLCYNEFGVYVDKHGDPSRSGGIIEWEGTAERVALHRPYILLFDTRFIEVRHIETGRLAQIIPGNDIRCTWDDRSVGTNLSVPVSTGQGMGGEVRVHGVMTSPEQMSMDGVRLKATAQCIFELVPTAPSYPPTPSNFK